MLLHLAESKELESHEETIQSDRDLHERYREQIRVEQKALKKDIRISFSFWEIEILFHEFFKAFVNESKCNLHIENIYGKNNHHIIESCYKGLARSLRAALELDPKNKNAVPSPKGSL